MNLAIALAIFQAFAGAWALLRSLETLGSLVHLFG